MNIPSDLQTSQSIGLSQPITQESFGIKGFLPSPLSPSFPHAAMGFVFSPMALWLARSGWATADASPRGRTETPLKGTWGDTSNLWRCACEMMVGMNGDAGCNTHVGMKVLRTSWCLACMAKHMPSYGARCCSKVGGRCGTMSSPKVEDVISAPASNYYQKSKWWIEFTIWFARVFFPMRCLNLFSTPSGSFCFMQPRRYQTLSSRQCSPGLCTGCATQQQPFPRCQSSEGWEIHDGEVPSPGFEIVWAEPWRNLDPRERFVRNSVLSMSSWWKGWNTKQLFGYIRGIPFLTASKHIMV